MSRSGVRNQTRLRLYEKLAIGILEGTHKVREAANLLVDVRFSEIPQAFANAIAFVAHRGAQCDVRDRFAHLLEYTTFVAFGTTERDAIPSWFLQNYECFLAASLHMLLTKYDIAVKFRLQTSGRQGACVAEARRAFQIAFDLCAGAKNYLSLDCLEASKGAQAVLVTLGARGSFESRALMVLLEAQFGFEVGHIVLDIAAPRLRHEALERKRSRGPGGAARPELRRRDITTRASAARH